MICPQLARKEEEKTWSEKKSWTYLPIFLGRMK